MQVPLPLGVEQAVDAPTQHCTSAGPAQYPDTEVPEQAEVCLHVPLPEGVEQGLLVQHLISAEPGHRLDV